MRSFPGRDVQVNVGFGANRVSDRPEVQLRQRQVTRLLDACSAIPVFDPDVVVGGVIGGTREITGNNLSRLQFILISNLIAIDFGAKL
jgi:hypothetical protein